MRIKKFIIAALIISLTLSLTGCFTLFDGWLNSSTYIPPDGTRLVIYRTDTDGGIDATDSLADVIEAVHASVVEINCSVSDGIAAGSGVIFANNDDQSEQAETRWVYVITNHHVIEGATSIWVRLTDGSEYAGTVFASDAEGDIAVVGINPAAGQTFDDFTYALLPTESYSARVGDEVFAIGNPLGTLGGTVSTGIVSALNRFITVEGTPMLLMQTDASINSGNSGGALFNRAGRLIGIVNAKAKGEGIEGIGFAIPIDVAMNVVQQLFEKGYVDRGVMGITLAELLDQDDMDAYLDQFYYRNGWGNTVFTDKASYDFWYDVFTDGRLAQYRYGIYVTSTALASEDTKAKLQKGDYVVAINGTAIKTSTDIKRALYGKVAGDVVSVTVYRHGTVGEPLQITLIART